MLSMRALTVIRPASYTLFNLHLTAINHLVIYTVSIVFIKHFTPSIDISLNLSLSIKYVIINYLYVVFFFGQPDVKLKDCVLESDLK